MHINLILKSPFPDKFFCVIPFKILFFLILMSQLLSCNKSNEVKGEGKSTKEIIRQSKVIDINNKIDSVGNYVFPVDSILKVEVLATGIYHGDEVNINADKKIWFGLFKTSKGFKFTKTELILNRIYDPIVDDDENEKTGWEVNTVINDTCLILIENQPYLIERDVKTINVPKVILPNEKFVFSFSGINYILFATGEKEKEDKKSDSFSISNYKLYLTANLNGKEQTEFIVTHSNFDDKMIHIIFAGDIDGDNKLDLIIDTSNHYNVSKPTIYLSKPANGKIIKPIGIFVSIGC